ncbi:MAG: GTP-binding protein [Euryarchaeota archaeon]|nr:GTP-binding protein [Euryarchaeota archaeon]
MGLTSRLQGLLKRVFGKKRNPRIGIYGPPNAGKTTLANRILRDFTGDVMGSVSPVPHETRRVRRREGVVIQANGSQVTMDIVDTPGLATKIDFEEFIKVHGMASEEAKRRAKEATEGVVEAIKWIDDCDGILLVLDATEDPYTQVNIVTVGNMEARGKPMVVVANKIDLPNAAPARIKSAFPQHPMVQISAREGQNIDKLYETLAKHFT